MKIEGYFNEIDALSDEELEKYMNKLGVTKKKMVRGRSAMKLTIGNLYKVGNTECTLREVKAEITNLWVFGKTEMPELIEYNCLMVNEDGFTRWVGDSELKEI